MAKIDLSWKFGFCRDMSLALGVLALNYSPQMTPVDLVVLVLVLWHDDVDGLLALDSLVARQVLSAPRGNLKGCDSTIVLKILIRFRITIFQERSEDNSTQSLTRIL
jgi:hypothetical protein